MSIEMNRVGELDTDTKENPTRTALEEGRHRTRRRTGPIRRERLAMLSGKENRKKRKERKRSRSAVRQTKE